VRLATDVYEGRCTAREPAHIASFATDGYIVFPRAAEPDLVDELVDDVRSIVASRHVNARVHIESAPVATAVVIYGRDRERGVPLRGQLASSHPGCGLTDTASTGRSTR
jgi:hypothetical protein